jgi:hypothetical protein
MTAVVVLQWEFSPRGYFEETVTIAGQDYTMTIEDGQVLARINSMVYEANPQMRQALHDALDARFLAVQLLTHRPYELSRSTMTRVNPDGRKDVFIEAQPGCIAISGCVADVRITDKDGNVVSDSKRGRVEKKKSLAESVASLCDNDALLVSLLHSYDAAVRDPNNELVYLYEIRDALASRFGGESATRSLLGLSGRDWSRLGQLCNNEPLRQGRHRGKTSGPLRDATEGELSEARGIARTMIETYLQCQEDSTNR